MWKPVTWYVNTINIWFLEFCCVKNTENSVSKGDLSKLSLITYRQQKPYCLKKPYKQWNIFYFINGIAVNETNTKKLNLALQQLMWHNPSFLHKIQFDIRFQLLNSFSKCICEVWIGWTGYNNTIIEQWAMSNEEMIRYRWMIIMIMITYVTNRIQLIQLSPSQTHNWRT